MTENRLIMHIQPLHYVHTSLNNRTSLFCNLNIKRHFTTKYFSKNIPDKKLDTVAHTQYTQTHTSFTAVIMRLRQKQQQQIQTCKNTKYSLHETKSTILGDGRQNNSMHTDHQWCQTEEFLWWKRPQRVINVHCTCHYVTESRDN